MTTSKQNKELKSYSGLIEFSFPTFHNCIEPFPVYRTFVSCFSSISLWQLIARNWSLIMLCGIGHQARPHTGPPTKQLWVPETKQNLKQKVHRFWQSLVEWVSEWIKFNDDIGKLHYNPLIHVQQQSMCCILHGSGNSISELVCCLYIILFLISKYITRRNATIPWKLKGAIQPPLSHHSVN